MTPIESYDHRYSVAYLAGILRLNCAGLAEPLVRLLRAYPAPLRVLDLGCGDGQVAELISGRGHRVTAVDGSEAAIRRARMLGSGHVDFQRQDLLSGGLAEAGEAYDLVTDIGFSHVISEPGERQIYWRFVTACLAPGGYYYSQSAYALRDVQPSGRSEREALELTTRTLHTRSDPTVGLDEFTVGHSAKTVVLPRPPAIDLRSRHQLEREVTTAGLILVDVTPLWPGSNAPWELAITARQPRMVIKSCP